MKIIQSLHKALIITGIVIFNPIYPMNNDMATSEHILRLYTQREQFIDSGKSFLVFEVPQQNKTALSLNSATLDTLHKKLVIREIKREKTDNPYSYYFEDNIEYVQSSVNDVIKKCTKDNTITLEEIEQELKKCPLKKIQISSPSDVGNNLIFLKSINISEAIAQDLPELEIVELELPAITLPKVQIKCGEQSIPLIHYAEANTMLSLKNKLTDSNLVSVDSYIIPIRTLPFFKSYLQKNYQNLDNCSAFNNKAKTITISGKQFKVSPEFLTIRGPNLLHLLEK